MEILEEMVMKESPSWNSETKSNENVEASVCNVLKRWYFHVHRKLLFHT